MNSPPRRSLGCRVQARGCGAESKRAMKQLRRPSLFFLTGLWLFGVAPPSSRGIQEPSSAQSREANFTLEGKITERGEGRLTVSMEGNILFRVLYNQETEIKQSDGGPASARDLRVGAEIYVEGDLSETGEITALKIELRPKRAPERR